MKNTLLKKLGFLLLILTIGISTSFAQYDNRPTDQDRPYGPKGPQGLMFLEIIPDLTDAQKTQIEDLHIEMQKKSTTLEAQLEIKKSELNSLIASDATMKDKEAKLKEITDLTFSLHLASIEYHHKVRELLDDKQKVAFDNWTINRADKKGPNNGPKGHKEPNKPKQPNR